MFDLENVPVLVLGLGVSGLAMARWAVKQGAVVTVADTRNAPPQLNALKKELPQVEFICCDMTETLINGSAFRAVFKSPGITPLEAQAVCRAASASGLWVATELDLFSLALKMLKDTVQYAPCILAITGTNGKTTVTSLTGQLVERSSKTVAVAGNIGPSLLDTLSANIEAETLPAVWVLELSSFQLENCDSFTPSMGVILNISQDHLDWHGSMGAYFEAKKRVFGNYGTMLLNRDDTRTMQLLPVEIKGKKLREWVSFGSDRPSRPGDFGLEEINGMRWLVRAMPADETRKKSKLDEQGVCIQRLMPVDALRIRGLHNALNALAALALATHVGCPLGPILYGLREYKGEPHRVESIAVVNGVEYFDDSKGTNVGATVAALSGLGVDRKLVVILGGDGKGQDFTPLAAPVTQYARAVILIGKDAQSIADALKTSSVLLHTADDMVGAVEKAAGCAEPGDAVLMSPACASLDMFDNYVHRANVFVAEVDKLAQKSGLAGVELTA